MGKAGVTLLGLSNPSQCNLSQRYKQHQQQQLSLFARASVACINSPETENDLSQENEPYMITFLSWPNTKSKKKKRKIQKKKLRLDHLQSQLLIAEKIEEMEDNKLNLLEHKITKSVIQRNTNQAMHAASLHQYKRVCEL